MLGFVLLMGICVGSNCHDVNLLYIRLLSAIIFYVHFYFLALLSPLTDLLPRICARLVVMCKITRLAR